MYRHRIQEPIYSNPSRRTQTSKYNPQLTIKEKREYTYAAILKQLTDSELVKLAEPYELIDSVNKMIRLEPMIFMDLVKLYDTCNKDGPKEVVTFKNYLEKIISKLNSQYDNKISESEEDNLTKKKAAFQKSSYYTHILGKFIEFFPKYIKAINAERYTKYISEKLGIDRYKLISKELHSRKMHPSINYYTVDIDVKYYNNRSNNACIFAYISYFSTSPDTKYLESCKKYILDNLSEINNTESTIEITDNFSDMVDDEIISIAHVYHIRKNLCDAHKHILDDIRVGYIAHNGYSSDSIFYSAHDILDCNDMRVDYDDISCCHRKYVKCYIDHAALAYSSEFNIYINICPCQVYNCTGSVRIR